MGAAGLVLILFLLVLFLTAGFGLSPPLGRVFFVKTPEPLQARPVSEPFLIDHELMAGEYDKGKDTEEKGNNCSSISMLFTKEKAKKPLRNSSSTIHWLTPIKLFFIILSQYSFANLLR